MTDQGSEAVVYMTGRRQNDSAERYQQLLQGVFAKTFRVLKPGRYVSESGPQVVSGPDMGYSELVTAPRGGTIWRGTGPLGKILNVTASAMNAT